MARSARLESSQEEEDDDLYSSSPIRRDGPTVHATRNPALSPSPAVSLSSDKENRSTSSVNQQQRGKGKVVMAPSSIQTVSPSRPENAQSSKRRRLADRDGPPQDVQSDHDDGLEETIDLEYYNPDQDMNERRAVRKGLRDLTRDLNDSRAEYLAPDSTGLVDTVKKANEYFHSVKQTSDATLDSRLLVSTADLSYKKTAQLTLGNAAQGIDVDEFVSKCITFMGHDSTPSDGAPNATNTPRNGSQSQWRHPARRNMDVIEDDDAPDEGDAMNWARLGERACFPSNLRPAVPSFLLGPLSLQKRTRAANTARRAPQRRTNPAELVRPQELQATDIEKQENSNLTILCTKIRKALVRAQNEGQEAVVREATALEDEVGRELNETERGILFDKHCVSDDGGVGFFRFVIHPRSFGQTVENLFYVSFLIRDGSVGIAEDKDGQPTLHASSPRTAAAAKAEAIQKHQAVFNLDHKTWYDIIDAFGILEPMIPNRTEVEEGSGADAVGATGWYG
ncbi:MAG: nuclear protein [Sclerophora amabilis]|nr:MAG: nuclear protein [Sclerophora amabilis]